ncbi:hem-containing dehydratase protein [Podospora australis]|uniref:Hem-containing dehydratase protein n=1 Tax=Podospora australis TaxID=1536484 RepID=A0AAN6WWL4_9PEZI|nr:hem-containing dehydratase protein [Podospora australis]
MSEIAMAIIGAQYKTGSDNDGVAQSTLSKFLTFSSNPPSFFEWASVTDGQGYYSISALAYWPSRTAYETWAAESGFQEWWQALNPEECRNGWFLEVFFPPMDRFETLFNTNQTPEGCAHMKESMSGEVQEHGYWGSMRDRLPAAQTASLGGISATTTAEDVQPESSDMTSRNRVSIPGKKNLAVIRSGQDWLDTSPQERTLYLETMGTK